MKRAIAVLAVASAAVAAPALAATQSTKITFTGWEIKGGTHNGTAKPGGTYKHCANNPTAGLVVHGKMSNPAKKGVQYAVTWKRNGRFVKRQDYKTGKHGKVRATFFGGVKPLADGKWEAVAHHKGQPAGKTSLTIKTSKSAC